MKDKLYILNYTRASIYYDAPGTTLPGAAPSAIKNNYIHQEWGMPDSFMNSQGYFISFHLQPESSETAASQMLPILERGSTHWSQNYGDFPLNADPAGGYGERSIFTSNYNGFASLGRRLDITFRPYIWNTQNLSSAPPAMDNLLEKEVVGIPYFKQYLKSGFTTGDVELEGTPYGTHIVDANVPPLADESIRHYDYRTEIPLPQQADLENADIMANVTSEYSFYQPFFEDQALNDGVDEYMLPNYYVMKHYFFNMDIPNSLMPPRYFDSVTLDSEVVSQTAPTYATGSSEYYRLWAETVEAHSNAGTLEGIRTSFAAKRLNHVAINHSQRLLLEQASSDDARSFPMHVNIQIQCNPHQECVNVPGYDAPGTSLDQRESTTLAFGESMAEALPHGAAYLYDWLLHRLIHADSAGVRRVLPGGNSTYLFEREGLNGNMTYQEVSNQQLAAYSFNPIASNWDFNLMSQIGSDFSALTNPDTSVGHSRYAPNALALYSERTGIWSAGAATDPMQGLNLLNPENWDPYAGSGAPSSGDWKDYDGDLQVLQPGSAESIRALQWYNNTYKNDGSAQPTSWAPTGSVNGGSPYQRLEFRLARNPHELLMLMNPGYTEPLVYKIEKRRIDYDPADDVSTLFYPLADILNNSGVPNPVQTFYLPALPESRIDETNSSLMTYIDTQVKYGQMYQYNISQIRLVDASSYQYQTEIIDDIGGFGHALGNALGFYRETENYGGQYPILGDHWWASLPWSVPEGIDAGEGPYYLDNEDTVVSDLHEGNYVYPLGLATTDTLYNSFGVMKVAAEYEFAQWTIEYGIAPSFEQMVEYYHQRFGDYVSIKLIPGHGVFNNDDGGAYPNGVKTPTIPVTKDATYLPPWESMESLPDQQAGPEIDLVADFVKEFEETHERMDEFDQWVIDTITAKTSGMMDEFMDKQAAGSQTGPGQTRIGNILIQTSVEGPGGFQGMPQFGALGNINPGNYISTFLAFVSQQGINITGLSSRSSAAAIYTRINSQATSLGLKIGAEGLLQTLNDQLQPSQINTNFVTRMTDVGAMVSFNIHQNWTAY